MIKTSDVVREIIYSSEVALTALEGGYLNLSAYSEHIKDEVEKKTKKQVKVGSIVVALSRLGHSLKKAKPLTPKIVVEDISIKSGLVEIAFDRTRDSLTNLQTLYYDKRLNSTEFFIVTHGVGEVTIITLEKVKEEILRVFRPQKPKTIIEKLVGVTVRLKEEYISTPNVIFALVRSLALKHINIVEIVSTFTELTFVLHSDNLQEAFLILNVVAKNATDQRK